MDRLKTTIFAALVIAILCAPTASAQATAANMTIISGNGQMPCLGCARKNFNFFYPLVVKVTDVNGAPIPNKVVNWQVTFTPGGPPALVDPTSTTDQNGLAYTHLNQGSQGGSAQVGFLQIGDRQPPTDSVSATFYENQALVDTNAFSAVIVFSQLVSPVDGAIGKDLGSGPAGTTGTVPIQVHVDARGTPVPNVSVRLLNNDRATPPR